MTFIPQIVSVVVSLAVSAIAWWALPSFPAQPVIQEIHLAADTTLPLAGTVYTLAGSGVSGSATSFTLTSFTIPQTGREILDADLSDTFYLTLEPGSRTRQEIISCTTVSQSGSDTTATISGCVRGLLPFSPYTASSTYQFAHGGGTSVVFSNPPQLYNEFSGKTNDEYITGVWTWASSSLPRVSTTPSYASGDELKFVTYGQLASTSFSGTVDGSQTQKGIFELADNRELAFGSSTGGTTAPLIAGSASFNATSTGTSTVPVAIVHTGSASATLSQTFFNFLEPWTFTATTTLASTTNLSGTVNITGTLNATGTANFASSSIPLLNHSRITSTADFVTQSGSYVNITGASTTMVVGQNHRVRLEFTGAASNATASDVSSFMFTVNSSTVSDGALQAITGFAGTGFRVPFHLHFVSDVLSTTSTQAFTFRTQMKTTASSTVYGATTSSAIWVFTASEIY